MNKLRLSTGVALITGATTILSLIPVLVLMQRNFEQRPPDEAHQLSSKRRPDAPPRCSTSVRGSDRKVRVNQSFVITVDVVVPTHKNECEIEVAIETSAFKVTPEHQEIQLSPNDPRSRDVSFSVLPEHAGTQSLIIHRGTVDEVQYFTVYDLPFIPPQISFWFPTIVSVAGGLFTVTWWLDGLEKRRERRSKASA
jgi:hypothetical protein